MPTLERIAKEKDKVPYPYAVILGSRAYRDLVWQMGNMKGTDLLPQPTDEIKEVDDLLVVVDPQAHPGTVRVVEEPWDAARDHR